MGWKCSGVVSTPRLGQCSSALVHPFNTTQERCRKRLNEHIQPARLSTLLKSSMTEQNRWSSPHHNDGLAIDFPSNGNVALRKLLISFAHLPRATSPALSILSPSGSKPAICTTHTPNVDVVSDFANSGYFTCHRCHVIFGMGSKVTPASQTVSDIQVLVLHGLRDGADNESGCGHPPTLTQQRNKVLSTAPKFPPETLQVDLLLRHGFQGLFDATPLVASSAAAAASACFCPYRRCRDRSEDVAERPSKTPLH